MLDGIKSVKSCKFPTSDGHTLHVEESGNLEGLPTLFLHGGPGAGIGQNYQALFEGFDLRLIAFDQRGCGRSQPFADIENNDTNKIIDDIEALRAYFNIDKWLVFGGSWGSTLGLAYAIAHPERVSGLILRGIFLARPDDAKWFVSGSQGASQVFPNEYANFSQGYNQANRTASKQQDLCQWYFSQLTHQDEQIRNQAASRWFNWEGNISKLKKMEMPADECASNQQIYSLALLECYYLLNNCFMPNNHILNNAHKITNIPMQIVHGRYDMVCKCESAIALHQALPQSILTIVEDAGHSVTEKGIREALQNALGQMQSLLLQK